MSKNTTRKSKTDWRRIIISGIALLLAVILIAGCISMAIQVM